MTIVPTDKTYVKNSSSGVRLISLDFYRGLIMVLLMLESSRLYDHLADGTKGTFAGTPDESVFSSSLAWTAFLGSDTTGFYVYCRGGDGLFDL